MKLLIDDEVFQQIMYYVEISPIECSGLGKVVIEGENLRVVSTVLLKQENTAATTDIEPAAVAKAMYELRDKPGTLNFWWHSHVNMSAFWSGTDTATIREIGANGFCIATVFNKKAESRTAYFQAANGFLPAIFMDELEMDTPRFLDDAKCKEWKADFDAKCTRKVWPSPTITEHAHWRRGMYAYGADDDVGWGKDQSVFDVSGYRGALTVPREEVSDDFFKYDPPLWDYRKVHSKGIVKGIVELEELVREDTSARLTDWLNNIQKADDERSAKYWLVKICQICNVIERHLTEPMTVSKELKDMYKKEFTFIANEHINRLKKGVPDANDITTDTH